MAPRTFHHTPRGAEVAAVTVLLQISDPHFGTEQPPVVQALLALSQRLAPDLVLLSGDITQRAQAEEFGAAKAFVDRLGAPALVMPGNHDIPLFDLFTRLSRPYARQQAVFGDELEPEHASPELLLLCVKTTRRRRHKNGEVSAAQIERVAARLATADPAQLRVVAVHHPIAVMRDEDRPDRLRGAEAALRRWAAAGCDLVLGGHIHLPYVMPLAGLARPMWAVQAGTAVSTRVRDGVPNSVNVLRWRDGSIDREGDTGVCRVEQWDHAAAEGAFVRRRVTELRPARHGVA